MARIIVENTDLTYRSTDTLAFLVTDDNGDPVNLNAVGSAFGVAIARNVHHNSPRILQKALGGPDIEVDPGQDNRALVTFTPDDYEASGTPQMVPRTWGYAGTAWYRAPEATEQALLNLTIMVHGTVDIDLNGGA